MSDLTAEAFRKDALDALQEGNSQGAAVFAVLSVVSALIELQVSVNELQKIIKQPEQKEEKQDENQ